jgi:hypothetical protein
LPHIENNLLFAAVDATQHTVNTSVAARPTVATQAPRTDHEMPWKAALGMQLPVAASLTGVFGTTGVGSSSDSEDDRKVKAALGKRTTR